MALALPEAGVQDDSTLVAALIGISFGLGWLGRAAQRALPALRVGLGVVMVGVGFYLLAGV